MARTFSLAAPLVSLTLAASLLVGCGSNPVRPAMGERPVVTASVKAQAAARKETRAQAEKRARGYIAEFNETRWRSIAARTLMVQKIARTDSDAAYDFLLEEIESLQELRGEMKTITAHQAEEYEEVLTEELDEMTPDQAEVKARVSKAEALRMDLDELTVSEELAAGPAAKWGGTARVGSRNRVLSAIQESKLYKAVSRAYKNTRRKVKSLLRSLCRKVRWC
jgi:TolA-binding protein